MITNQSIKRSIVLKHVLQVRSIVIGRGLVFSLFLRETSLKQLFFPHFRIPGDRVSSIEVVFNEIKARDDALTFFNQCWTIIRLITVNKI